MGEKLRPIETDIFMGIRSNDSVELLYLWMALVQSLVQGSTRKVDPNGIVLIAQGNEPAALHEEEATLNM